MDEILFWGVYFYEAMSSQGVRLQEVSSSQGGHISHDLKYISWDATFPRPRES